MGKHSHHKKNETVVASEEESSNNNNEAVEGIQFGKMLASPDKRVRDRTVKNFTKWLRAAELENGGFTELELLKIWKGLFYCMWYSDKTPIQQELAQTLAEFIHVFRKDESSVLFFETFFKTMQREWHGIDQYRVEKYYSLIRKVVHESFVWLHKSDWKESRLDSICNAYEDAVFECKTARGIRNQVLDVYLTELCKVGGKTLQMSTFQELLGPCYTILLNTFKSDTLFARTIKEVFLPLKENQFVDATVRQEVDKAEVVTDTLSLPPQPVGGFDYLNFGVVAQSLFEVAADGELVKDAQRKKLYELSKEFKRAAKALLASKSTEKERARKMESPEKSSSNKRRKTDVDHEAPTPESTKKSKSKKHKKSKGTEKQTSPAKQSEEMEEQPVDQMTTPSKKSKKKKKSRKSKTPEPAVAIEEEVAPSTPVNAPSTPLPTESVKKSVSFALHQNKVSNLKKITKKMKRTPYKRTETTPPPALKKTSMIPPAPQSERRHSNKSKSDFSKSKKGSKSARKANRVRA